MSPALTDTPQVTYLITGANRGLGKGFVEHYLLQPNTTVIAGVRDPTHITSKALTKLPKGASSSIIVLKIENASESDALAAIEELQARNITALDVVIANAAIGKVYPTVATANPTDLQEHFLVNVIGTIVLFQATLPLLNNAKNPKFVAMGSSAGSIGGIDVRNFPNAVYGTSKAALNYVTRKMHFEHPNLTAFSIDPGWVRTDMGNHGAKIFGLEEAEITPAESVAGVSKVIEEATRSKSSGRFILYTGEECSW